MFWEKVVGLNIRRIRKEAGLSQEQLAHKADMDMRYLGGIERGEYNPTVAMLGKIAEALGVHPAIFLNDKRTD
ncbi:helix-turn-helix transcriptional regulator [Hyphomonas sp. FCG-A18]|uniref:helix-turn-helix domain-containing protein n=1 Tax=Hyphomonas sp. FCG-A18 TaxID=3080019 RepID=UPI002B2A5D7E|nr:helix-turn-helix transcriptional regulator [Hyphomonas sp. FCG-A18]